MVAGDTEEQAEVAAIQTSQDPIMEVLQSLVERMDHLEASAIRQGKTRSLTRNQPSCEAQLYVTSAGKKDILLEGVLLAANQDRRKTICPQRCGTGN